MRMMACTVLYLAVAAGCCPLARPAKIFLQSVGSEYTEYVRKDTRLSADAKRIRLQHVVSFRRAVEEANR